MGSFLQAPSATLDHSWSGDPFVYSRNGRRRSINRRHDGHSWKGIPQRPRLEGYLTTANAGRTATTATDGRILRLPILGEVWVAFEDFPGVLWTSASAFPFSVLVGYSNELACGG
jgi:hypothetical protein